MRGDEDYHIYTVLRFAQKIKATIFFHLPFVILTILFLVAAFRKSKYFLVFGIGVLAYFILFGASEQVSHSAILRYPFFTRVFQVLPPVITSAYGGLYSELTYRIVPFVSVIIMAWLTQRYRPFPDQVANLLVGIAIGTMPLVYYYASILYLEMPAVVLMLIVCFHIDRLLNDPFQKVKQQPAWYALLILGLIKETAVIFLLLFFLFRIITQIRLQVRKQERRPIEWSDELTLLICLSIPIMIYLLYRSYFGTTRNTSFELINLIQLKVYGTLFLSFLEQFGFFCILFIAGCYLLIRKRRFVELWFAVASIIVSSLFYILENTKWAGYSRFNLFALPMIVIVSKEFLSQLHARKGLVFSVLLITIFVNFLLSPVNFDGTKKPMWGNYLVDTSEHYYPYRETFLWLSENYRTPKLLFSGMNYPYFSSFYFKKYDWSPQSAMLKSDYRDEEESSLTKALETASLSDFTILIFQFRNDKIATPYDSFGYRLIKIFRNQAHLIGVYTK